MTSITQEQLIAAVWPTECERWRISVFSCDPNTGRLLNENPDLSAEFVFPNTDALVRARTRVAKAVNSLSYRTIAERIDE